MCRCRKDDVSDTPFIIIRQEVHFLFKVTARQKDWSIFRKVHGFGPIAETHESDVMFQNILFESTENLVWRCLLICGFSVAVTMVCIFLFTNTLIGEGL